MFTTPPPEAVIRLVVLPPVLVNVPVMLTVLPAPVDFTKPLLVVVLLRARMPPFVASAVPLLMKLVWSIVSVLPADELALTNPLLVSVPAAFSSDTFPKPCKTLPLPSDQVPPLLRRRP